MVMTGFLPFSLLQNGRDGLARTEREISREIFAHDAANAVRSKQFSHRFMIPLLKRFEVLL